MYEMQNFCKRLINFQSIPVSLFYCFSNFQALTKICIPFVIPAAQRVLKSKIFLRISAALGRDNKLHFHHAEQVKISFRRYSPSLLQTLRYSCSFASYLVDKAFKKTEDELSILLCPSSLTFWSLCFHKKHFQRSFRKVVESKLPNVAMSDFSVHVLSVISYFKAEFIVDLRTIIWYRHL